MGNSGYAVEEDTYVRMESSRVFCKQGDDVEYVMHRYDIPELDYYIYAMTLDNTVLFEDHTSKLLVNTGHISIYTHYLKETSELRCMTIHIDQPYVLMEDIVELLVNIKDTDLRILDISIHHILYVITLYVDTSILIGTDKGTLSIEDYQMEILKLMKESK